MKNAEEKFKVFMEVIQTHFEYLSYICVVPSHFVAFKKSDSISSQILGQPRLPYLTVLSYIGQLITVLG